MFDRRLVFGFCIFLAIILFATLWVKQGQRTHQKLTGEHRELYDLILSLLPPAATDTGDKTGILILKIYSAGCWLCHLEAVSYRDHQDRLQHAQVVFASFDTPEQIRGFNNKYGLNQYANTFLLALIPCQIPEALRYPPLPSLYIYGPGGELLFASFGPTPWESLIERIKTQTH